MIMKTMRDLRGCIYSKIVCSPRKSTRAQSISESADIRVINTSKADISDFRGTFMVWPLIGGLEKAMFYANQNIFCSIGFWHSCLGKIPRFHAVPVHDAMCAYGSLHHIRLCDGRSELGMLSPTTVRVPFSPLNPSSQS